MGSGGYGGGYGTSKGRKGRKRLLIVSHACYWQANKVVVVEDSVALVALEVNKVATVASSRATLPHRVDSPVATVADSPVTVVNKALPASKVDSVVNRVDLLLSKAAMVHLRVATEGESAFSSSLLFAVVWAGGTSLRLFSVASVVGASAAGHRKKRVSSLSLSSL